MIKCVVVVVVVAVVVGRFPVVAVTVGFPAGRKAGFAQDLPKRRTVLFG